MANEDAGRKSKVAATEDQSRARATGSRKPGVVGRMMDQCRNTVEAIRLPRPDWRTFLWGLLILIGVIFIVRNWAPLRINFFGWYLDAPRAVVFAVFFALGMVTTWLIEVRSKRARAADEAEEQQRLSETDEAERWASEEDAQAQAPAEEPRPAPEGFAEEPVAEDEGEDAEMNFTPLPDDFGDDIESTEDDDVQPDPEEFAPVAEEDEPEDAGVVAHFDDAATEDEADRPAPVEDETAGDALSDDYGFDQPAGDTMSDEELLADDDWESDSDVADDGEQESAEGDADEAASEEDDGKPFWRL